MTGYQYYARHAQEHVKNLACHSNWNSGSLRMPKWQRNWKNGHTHTVHLLRNRCTTSMKRETWMKKSEDSMPMVLAFEDNQYFPNNQYFPYNQLFQTTSILSITSILWITSIFHIISFSRQPVFSKQPVFSIYPAFTNNQYFPNTYRVLPNGAPLVPLHLWELHIVGICTQCSLAKCVTLGVADGDGLVFAAQSQQSFGTPRATCHLLGVLAHNGDFSVTQTNSLQPLWWQSRKFSIWVWALWRPLFYSWAAVHMCDCELTATSEYYLQWTRDCLNYIFTPAECKNADSIQAGEGIQYQKH